MSERVKDCCVIVSCPPSPFKAKCFRLRLRPQSNPVLIIEPRLVSFEAENVVLYSQPTAQRAQITNRSGDILITLARPGQTHVVSMSEVKPKIGLIKVLRYFPFTPQFQLPAATVETGASTAAKLRPTFQTHRDYIAARVVLPLRI
jgi:hypothetical protein